MAAASPHRTPQLLFAKLISMVYAFLELTCVDCLPVLLLTLPIFRNSGQGQRRPGAEDGCPTAGRDRTPFHRRRGARQRRFSLKQ